MPETTTKNKGVQKACYHCGDICTEPVTGNGLVFCCEGCHQVYLLLNENGLCRYYDLDITPGLKGKGKFTGNRFAYLDDPLVIARLLRFSSEKQVHVFFHLPQVHCSSCVFLLENLHRINKGVLNSQLDFHRKELFIVYDPGLITLRQLVELLAFIGYEPAISLEDISKKKKPGFDRRRIYKLGVAGFCFSNIMMLSFPEYFSSGNIGQAGLKQTFMWLTLLLSLPVILYAAKDFFISAWRSLQQGVVNIDGPISLAIAITFFRSYYEIISGTGSGYLDSGSGIVFFMLVGRWFQDKTYGSLAFDRDYTSYFPLGVTVIREGREKGIPVTVLKKGDHIVVRNGEMIPADAILLKGESRMDYSFVSGETTLLRKNAGEIIYAGAKQSGGAIELEVVNEVSQSYITRLWNNDLHQKRKNPDKSFIHPWSRYFTAGLFTVALITAVYWLIMDTSLLWSSVTAVLIVACPCSLLLSATFTFGNMMRVFGRNHLYLKNAAVIEALSSVDTIVFDKTGTITSGNEGKVVYQGEPLNNEILGAVCVATAQSAHPLSRAINASLSPSTSIAAIVRQFREYKGEGIEAVVNDMLLRLGSAVFIGKNATGLIYAASGTNVYLSVNGEYKGRFGIMNNYRDGIYEMAGRFKNRYELHILSGDNDSEAARLKKIFGGSISMRFRQSPQEKMDYIKELQSRHRKVLMLGDGLNDAGALLQAEAGIAVTDNTVQFTPSCDAILEGKRVSLLPEFLSYARKGRRIVTISFIVSILYNIAGLSFAVRGILSPLVAAILMPVSSVTIVLLAMLFSAWEAKRNGLGKTA